MLFDLKRWFFFVTALGFLGCATTTNDRLQNVKAGMDKTEVLEIAGNPKWTNRQAGGDLWVYVYYIGETRMQRGVGFQNGHVSEVLPEMAVTGANADAASSDVIIRDYEKLVEEAAKAKSQKSKFVPVGEGD